MHSKIDDLPREKRTQWVGGRSGGHGGEVIFYKIILSTYVIYDEYQRK